jgi:hypothetical protein
MAKKTHGGDGKVTAIRPGITPRRIATEPNPSAIKIARQLLARAESGEAQVICAVYDGARVSGMLRTDALTAHAVVLLGIMQHDMMCDFGTTLEERGRSETFVADSPDDTPA